MGVGHRTYTVSELEEITGIARRTIHFYVKEGVIAPPDGAGGGARYGEEHLLRLQLTRELQKSHLKLSGIREAMDRLSLEQMRSMLRKTEPSAKVWDKASLERWLEERVAGAAEPDPKWNRSMLELAENGPAQAVPPRATWEHIVLAEGLEVHVRSDLVQRYRSAVDELVRQIREGR